LSRLETLKKLESRLEIFLTSVAAASERPKSGFDDLGTLKEIAADSRRGRYVNNRLADWFEKNRQAVTEKAFDEAEVTQIANLLEDIRKGLNAQDSLGESLIGEIDGLRARGVVPRRKFVLKLRRRPEAEDDMFKKFVGMLSEEIMYLDSGQFKKNHLLTILDDALASAEAKIDPTFLHLAGSIIYYLRINGFKVTPFVRRLKEIEKKKLGEEAK
jgi:hypothetical protein